MSDVINLYNDLGGQEMFGSAEESPGGGNAASSIIGGLVSVATTVVSGAMQSSATSTAASQAAAMEEKRLASQEKLSDKELRLQRQSLGLDKRGQDMQQQQFMISRADGLKQLDKRQFDGFANRMLKKGTADVMYKQALFSMW